MGIEERNQTKQQNLDIYNLSPCVAIVSLDNDLPPVPTMMAPVYYQVTILREKISDSGEFIRFGDVEGDEILGWKAVKDIAIQEVLFEFSKKDGDYDIPFIERPMVEVS